MEDRSCVCLIQGPERDNKETGKSNREVVAETFPEMLKDT